MKMPILPREPDVYPLDLLETWHLGDSDARWYLLYTLSRREKELSRRLIDHEVPFYGPMIPRKHRSPSGRERKSYVPLFPGYVFLFGNEDQRVVALQTNCISRVLTVHDPDRLVSDLSQIQTLVELDAPLTPESQLGPGRRVRIRNGALLGVEGVVFQRRGQSRLLVAVDFLQQGASVLLDDYLVEPLD